MANPKQAPARRRNAEATRAAILASARAAFARSGYEGAGVREIAAAAGVTAMLVNRYFGSKEGLFAEVVAATMASPRILAPANLGSRAPAEALAAELVEITRPDAVPLEGFLVMLRSAGSARAAEIAREQIERHHQKTMTSALRGPQAAMRAAVVLSIVAGVQTMRQVIGLTALSDADPEALARLLAPLFRQLIEGTAQASRR
jgi:AcrR family transcriptional regulator